MNSTGIMQRLADMRPWQRALVAFVGGLLCVPALPPWNIWPCLIIGIGLFYAVLSNTQNERIALLSGWTFGFGFFLPGLSWIGNALLIDGSEYKWAWPLAIAALPAMLSVFTGLSAALWRRLFKPLSISGYLGFSLCLCLGEWLRGNLFTGFPWNLFGYTWSSILPVAQIASFTGIYGLTLLTIIWAALPASILMQPQKKSRRVLVTATAVALSFGSCWLYGAQRLENLPTAFDEKTVIRIVQPNIAQTDKWKPQQMHENAMRIIALSTAQPVNDYAFTVIVWPETALTDKMLQQDDIRQALKDALASYGHDRVLLAAGHLRHEKREDSSRYYNSISMIERNLSLSGIYDKTHLVPFGEYIPFQKWIPLTPVTRFSGFSSGEGLQLLTTGAGLRIAPLVCYEIIFPGKITDKSAPRPDVVINVTNDGWYGDSAGPHQHFAMGIFRAIEEGLPVVRAANTGISGVIDPAGRIVHRIELGEQRGLNAVLPLKTQERTIFSKAGNVVFMLMMASLAVFSFIIRAVEQE